MGAAQSYELHRPLLLKAACGPNFEHEKPGAFLLPVSLLLGFHQHITICTFDVHNLGSSYAVPTAGANILDTVAVGDTSCGLACGVARACTTWHIIYFNTVHPDVLPALLQNKLVKRVCRFRDAPTYTRVVADF